MKISFDDTGRHEAGFRILISLYKLSSYLQSYSASLFSFATESVLTPQIPFPDMNTYRLLSINSVSWAEIENTRLTPFHCQDGGLRGKVMTARM